MFTRESAIERAHEVLVDVDREISDPHYLHEHGYGLSQVAVQFATALLMLAQALPPTPVVHEPMVMAYKEMP